MKQLIKSGLLLFFLIATFETGKAQNYLSANETIIFSFQTQSGKRMVLAKDTSDKYIVYRFGTKKKIEFEFPVKDKDSWKKFTYSYYFRGGGIENEGLDLDYVYFTNNHKKYIIYNTFSSEDNHPNCGIKVLDIPTNKTIDIRGIIKTRKGNLNDFRDNGLLEIGEELFD